MNGTTIPSFSHHRLQAYQVALDFVRLIHATPVADAEMRKQRNLAEGSGRRSRADKQRCYGIARGELCEAVSAVEIDQALGACSVEQLRAVHQLGSRLDAMLAALTR